MTFLQIQFCPPNDNFDLNMLPTYNIFNCFLETIKMKSGISEVLRNSLNTLVFQCPNNYIMEQRWLRNWCFNISLAGLYSELAGIFIHLIKDFTLFKNRNSELIINLFLVFDIAQWVKLNLTVKEVPLTNSISNFQWRHCKYICVWLFENLKVMYVPLKQLFKTELHSVPLVHRGTMAVTSKSFNNWPL